MVRVTLSPVSFGNYNGHVDGCSLRNNVHKPQGRHRYGKAERCVCYCGVKRWRLHGASARPGSFSPANIGRVVDQEGKER